jgi:nucleoside-diphosphate-sugar epimerase
MQPITTLITGATGVIGPHLVAQLLNDGLCSPVGILIRPASNTADRQKQLISDILAGLGPATVHTHQSLAQTLRFIPGDVTCPQAPPDLHHIQLVIHAAADTRFRLSANELHAVNIQGVRHVLDWASTCPNLKRFLYVSTCCVAGTRTGSISESPAPAAPYVPHFLNPYEQSKWQAERLVQTSSLPVTTARLSSVIGSEKNGAISRPGAFHHALKWMFRGLIPMVPGAPETPVDLISSEYAAAYLSRLALAPHKVPSIIQVAAGSMAMPLSRLLAIAVESFKSISPAWRLGQIAPPMTVDAQTYNLFEDSITRSGDTLFKAVLDSSRAFLPGLLYPKVYQTTSARSLFPSPPAPMDVHAALARVITQTIAPDSPVLQLSREARHA